MLSYSVNVNKYGAVDLSFNIKPDNSILDQVKAKGFKWFKTGKCWSTFKFKTKEECVNWLDSILSDTYVIEKYASNENLIVKVDNNTTQPKKALEKAKNSLKKNSKQYFCEEYKLTAYYNKIKDELNAKYDMQDMILLLRENGYACIKAESFEKLKASDRNKLLKNYVVYSI